MGEIDPRVDLETLKNKLTISVTTDFYTNLTTRIHSTHPKLQHVPNNNVITLSTLKDREIQT